MNLIYDKSKISYTTIEQSEQKFIAKVFKHPHEDGLQARYYVNVIAREITRVCMMGCVYIMNTVSVLHRTVYTG